MVPARGFFYYCFYLIKVSCYLSRTLDPNDPTLGAGFLAPTVADPRSCVVELALAPPAMAEAGFGAVVPEADFGPLELEARAPLRLGVDAAAKVSATR